MRGVVWKSSSPHPIFWWNINRFFGLQLLDWRQDHIAERATAQHRLHASKTWGTVMETHHMRYCRSMSLLSFSLPPNYPGHSLNSLSLSFSFICLYICLYYRPIQFTLVHLLYSCPLPLQHCITNSISSIGQLITSIRGRERAKTEGQTQIT